MPGMPVRHVLLAASRDTKGCVSRHISVTSPLYHKNIDSEHTLGKPNMGTRLPRLSCLKGDIVMKTLKWKKGIAIVLSLGMLLAALPFAAQAAVVNEEDGVSVADQASQATLAGAAAAEADGDYTLEDMLHYALEDEYAAQAEYAAIMDEYGTQRPFSNIIRSEQTHIDMLLPLFEAHDVAVPVNDAASRTVLPTSLPEAFAIGVEAEIKNIAMYEAFLEEDLPDDVRLVFERLMNASVSHQKAFEQAGERAGGTAAGTRGRATDDEDNWRGGNANAGYGRGRATR